MIGVSSSFWPSGLSSSTSRTTAASTGKPGLVPRTSTLMLLASTIATGAADVRRDLGGRRVGILRAEHGELVERLHRCGVEAVDLGDAVTGDAVEVAAAAGAEVGMRRPTIIAHEHAQPPGLHDRDLHLARIGVADVVGVLGDALHEQLGEQPGPHDRLMDHPALRDRHELLRHRDQSPAASTGFTYCSNTGSSGSLMWMRCVCTGRRS